MGIEGYIARQLEAHPSMQAQDVVKLCYHAACGAEHMLADFTAAREYLAEEMAATAPDGACPMWEAVSDEYCRVNLAPWKAAGLSEEWLFNIFKATAAERGSASGCLEDNLKAAESLLEIMPFSRAEWAEYIASYRKRGMPPVHHSEGYHAAERPAYRLVQRRFMRLLPVLLAAAKCKARPCVIAIDGRAASGKTSAARDLALIMEADTVHMDDFFLPPELRSEARRREAGGNVHYERFISEVLGNIRSDSFSYRVFDCGSLSYCGSSTVSSAVYRLVEGSYSLHPAFGDYADIKVFSSVDAAEQRRRILLRDGEAMAEKFEKLWVPMEEKYFESFSIASKCDVLL